MSFHPETAGITSTLVMFATGDSYHSLRVGILVWMITRILEFLIPKIIVRLQPLKDLLLRLISRLKP